MKEKWVVDTMIYSEVKHKHCSERLHQFDNKKIIIFDNLKR